MVDFGDDIDAEVQDGTATHALVVIFLPCKVNWVQPITCLALKNAASPRCLREIIIKAIVLLYNNNTIVKNRVCVRVAR